MTETSVINIKQAPAGWRSNPRHYTFIGRPSYLGNPFAIGRNGTREDVIEAYRQYLPRLRAKDPEMFDKYIDVCVRGHVLVCFCKPLACHGDVLIEWLEQKP